MKRWTEEEDKYLIRKMKDSKNVRQTAKELTLAFPDRTYIAIERRWYIIRKNLPEDKIVIEPKLDTTTKTKCSIKEWFKNLFKF